MNRVGDNLKKDNKHKVVVGILPLLPQEQCLPPHQRHAQSNQKPKQKQISQKNNDQERRRPRNDPILMSYAHLLPILVNDGAIMPKWIQPAGFPYHPKHDPSATCGYHTGHVRHSIENCNPLKVIVQELINQKLLGFTPMIVEAPVEKRFEYKGHLIRVQVPPLVVQPAMQHLTQGHRPRMPLAYPGTSSSTVVAPQHA